MNRIFVSILVICLLVSCLAAGCATKPPVTTVPSVGGSTPSVGGNETQGSVPGVTLPEHVIEPDDGTVPSSKPTDPAVDPTDPTTQPGDPVVDPTDPTTQPGDPVVDPTNPTTQPGDPVVDPTNPTTQPGDPVVDPTDPTTQPTDPSETTPSTPPADPVYTITYAGLEGQTHNNPRTYTAATAAGITLQDPSKRNGYTFKGWYIGSEQVTTLEGRTGDLTLTAKWESEPITLPDVPF